MERALRFLAYAATLSLVSLVFLFQLRPDALWFAPVGAAILFVAAVTAGEASIVLLGAAFCTVPILGPGALSLAVSGWLFGLHLGTLFDTRFERVENRMSRELALFAFLLILLPLLCGVALTFTRDYDSPIFQAVARYGGIYGLYLFLSGSPLSWFRALADLSGFIAAGLLFLTFVALPRPRQQILRFVLGLALGTLAGIAVLILQLSQPGGAGGFLDANITPFWRMVGRYPAAFSDPNAFGVMSLLLITLFYGISRERHRRFYRLLVLALLVLSTWAGSRTLYLGLVIWLLVSGFLAVRRTGRKDFAVLFGFAVLWLGIFVGLLGYPKVNAMLQENFSSPGVIRVLKTVNWDEAGAMFSSRAVYAKLALTAWTSSPITGIGVQRFYDRQSEFMEKLGVDLGGWQDNANNYYLQVLAEQGILGFAATLLAFALFLTMFMSPASYDEEGEAERSSLERMYEVAQTILGVFAVILITGPHVAFEEVRFLVFALLAFAAARPISIKPNFLTYVRTTVLVLLCAFPAAYSFSSEVGGKRLLSRGFYGPESMDGGEARWSVTPARLMLCGDVPRTVTVDFRSLEPGLEHHPLKVLVHEGEQPTRDTAVGVELSDNNWTSVTIPITQERSPILVTIRVERLWSPAIAQHSADSRWLGVMVKWPKEAC